MSGSKSKKGNFISDNSLRLQTDSKRKMVTDSPKVSIIPKLDKKKSTTPLNVVNFNPSPESRPVSPTHTKLSTMSRLALHSPHVVDSPYSPRSHLPVGRRRRRRSSDKFQGRRISTFLTF